MPEVESETHARVTSNVPLGDPFPVAELVGATGEATSIDKIRAGGSAVVIFYRGAWCPYCNLALRTYREALSGPLRDRGVALIAVSSQLPDGSLTMTEKHDLDFPVVSDPGNQLARALGVVMRPTEAYLASQLESGLDLTTVNADGTVELAIPTTAIIDPDGRLVWIDVRPEISVRTDPHEILDALRGLGL